MRILMLNYEYPPLGGGASPITQALSEHLAGADHEVDVVTMHYRGLSRFEDHGRLRIHRVPCLRHSQVRAITIEMLSYVIAAIIRCLVLTKRDRYDVIHAHFIIPTGLVSLVLRYVRGIPTVITVHGSDIPHYNPDRFKRGHWLLAPLWRWLTRSTDAIISPSRYLRSLLHASCEVPVDIIPYGFTPPPLGTLPRKRRILTASRLFPRKGVQFLLDALAELDLDGWEVVVAGDGPMLPHLQAQARRLNLPVHFTGFLQHDELSDYYASSEIFVFPSMRDNFPVVLLEGLSAGCAVITSDVSGMPEVLGDAGVLVPPGDVPALRDALQRLMSDARLRQELSAQAEQRIARFAWERILEEHLTLYQRIISTRTARREMPTH
jgi:glycosyltransferase involved in cell wall biosynthesis